MADFRPDVRSLRHHADALHAPLLVGREAGARLSSPSAPGYDGPLRRRPAKSSLPMPSAHSAASTIDAALLHRLRRHRHPLHRLVEVEVGGIAHVGGDDDVVAVGDRRQGLARRPGRCRRRGRPTSSPAKTPVISLRLVQGHVDAGSVGRVARATSAISSKTGLPSVTHQVAFGSARSASPWLLRMVSAPAMPGSTALPPPE